MHSICNRIKNETIIVKKTVKLNVTSGLLQGNYQDIKIVYSIKSDLMINNYWLDSILCHTLEPPSHFPISLNKLILTLCWQFNKLIIYKSSCLNLFSNYNLYVFLWLSAVLLDLRYMALSFPSLVLTIWSMVPPF